MKKIISAITAVCASLILFTGCTPKEETEYSSRNSLFLSMNTEASLIVSDIFTTEKKNKFEEMSQDISNTLNKINNSLSVNVLNSSINKFNQADAGETVEIDNIAFEVLTLAKNVYDLTGGYYNPAVYYNVQAYGFNESSVLGKPLDEIRVPV